MMMRKRQKICHGRKQKTKQKNLPRINTEFHGNKQKQKQKNKICQGISRKQNTAFRAGCVSDRINLRFGEAPSTSSGTGVLRGTVSELAELTPFVLSLKV